MRSRYSTCLNTCKNTSLVRINNNLTKIHAGHSQKIVWIICKVSDQKCLICYNDKKNIYIFSALEYIICHKNQKGILKLHFILIKHKNQFTCFYKPGILGISHLFFIYLLISKFWLKLYRH